MIFLAILDGFGLAGDPDRNAIVAADTPFFDRAWMDYPGREIYAHGEYVGLPKGQMGNSEVGHLNIGGGRRIRPDLVIINDLIADGGFFKNKALLGLIEKVKARGGRLHVMGLLSDGGIHSHILHLEALLKLINDNGPVPVLLHPYLDGRDTGPKVADRYIKQAQQMLDKFKGMYFATVGGRSWGMDRDKNWPRIEKHYNAIVRGISEVEEPDALTAIKNALSRGETDEFVTPAIIELPEGVAGKILDGDGVIHFNFRADRAIQMTRALSDENFNGFDVSDRPGIDMVTFTMYDEYLNVKVAFEGEILHNTLTEVLSKAGRKVFKIAETEKWAHVTKFFNGGIMEPFALEDRELVQSPLEVRPHYDKKPEMSANEVTEKVLEKFKSYDLVVLNFANPDMVGHSGVFEAAVKAVETVDGCLARIYEQVKSIRGILIVTADHGNADIMKDEKGEPYTKHTTSPVPFIIMDKDIKLRGGEGSLQDIAPTILYLMGIRKPVEMTGTSLVIAGI
ncbi:MAG: 2,3-bisphosphoglycerate-independent phosphoglycerate mutase [bacterium]|nr:2,3-bisphosphoglycerate-independent phosphoglycerate mutase [bacterium]